MTQETFLSLPVRVQCLRIPAVWTTTHRMSDDWWSAELARGEAKCLDIWAERDSFLRLPCTEQFLIEQDALAVFLERIGLFDKTGIDDALFDPRRMGGVARYEHGGYTYEARRQPLRDARHFAEMRQWVSELMTDEGWNDNVQLEQSGRFTLSPYEATIDLKSEPPCVRITTTAFMEAVLLSIYLDRLRGHKFLKCAREDCGVHFSAGSKYKRKYCKWYCGHIESVRRSRDPKKASRVRL